MELKLNLSDSLGDFLNPRYVTGLLHRGIGMLGVSRHILNEKVEEFQIYSSLLNNYIIFQELINYPDCFNHGGIWVLK